MLRSLWKPWFVYRPFQIVRRIVTEVLPPRGGYAPLRTSWGTNVIADPTRTIGRSILTTGLYDLAVSEALFRLISPGDTVVDAGANVGYMTVLASVATGSSGKVLSFEPHPELFDVLRRNVTALRSGGNIARVDLHQAALGDSSGTASLQLPVGFEKNDGIARISSVLMTTGQSLIVPLMTLDETLIDERVGVLKLDVEGFELNVLRGSERLLAERSLRHIVFEDHAIAESEVVALLRQAGYSLFALGWSMHGPTVRPVEMGSLATQYEAPSFIGTSDPESVIARFRPKGWLALNRHATHSS